jgi:hypothetical protein
MAELKDLRPPVDLTRGVGRGLDIVRTLKSFKQAAARETREEEAFELNKKVTEQKLEADIQKERDRQESVKIDRVQGMWEVAHKAGNQEAKDTLRAELSKLTGFQITADDEELGNLLADRRQAVRAGDTETVQNIDDYLIEVRSMTAEEAARRTGIETEVAALEAERLRGEAIETKEAEFELKKGQAKELQLSIEQQLKDIPDLEEQDRTLMALAGSGQIPANILPTLMKNKDITFRTGMAGTGQNEGKSVTKLLDSKGNPILDEQGNPIELLEAGPERRGKTSITTERDLLTGAIKPVGFKEVLDKDGNVIGIERLPILEGGKAVEGEEAPTVDIKENFSFQEYKAMLANPERTDEQQKQDAYIQLLRAGMLKRPKGKGVGGAGVPGIEAGEEERPTGETDVLESPAAAKELGKEARKGLKEIPGLGKITKDVFKGLGGLFK